MRKLTGFWRHVVTALSVMLVLFQLYTAGFGVFPDIVQRSVHLFFVLTMLFLLMPANKKKKTDTVPWYDVVLSMICMVCTGYMILIYEKILWDPSQWINSFDKICAVLLTILILEGSRRAVGLTFPIMAAFFLFYAAFGQIFPGLWAHKNFSFNQIFQNLYHTTNGIWGQMVGLSAGMLAMFGIFGAILSVTGGSQTFIRLAQKMTGKAVGGPGKVALIASGLFGMVSGSAMANVVATGTFTIPMMKDAGYSKEWSAAISAVGSTGGQIMPPIMGAGAFIMAQLIGLSYLTIAKAAIVPALLYYMGAFVALHYLSKRLKIFGEGCKEKIRVIEFAIIFVPLAVFIAFLAVGYTVTKAAFYATVVSVIVTVFSFVMATDGKAGRRAVHEGGEIRRGEHPQHGGTAGGRADFHRPDLPDRLRRQAFQPDHEPGRQLPVPLPAALHGGVLYPGNGPSAHGGLRPGGGNPGPGPDFPGTGSAGRPSVRILLCQLWSHHAACVRRGVPKLRHRGIQLAQNRRPVGDDRNPGLCSALYLCLQ